MKLEIWRDQKDMKGLLGGHKGVRFSLIARVQVSPEEQELIDKYKVADDVLTTYQISDSSVHITVRGLLSGHGVEAKDVSAMISIEGNIKVACANLKNWLAVMKTFGGYEAIDV